MAGCTYLGGHSTGGTLALLAAESSSRFRAVFAFGPADDVALYGSSYLNFDTSNQKEVDLRAPILWLNSIHNLTFVFEGESGNIEALRALSHASSNPTIHFYQLDGFTHFSTLAPMTKALAAKILADTGPASSISFTGYEVIGLTFVR